MVYVSQRSITSEAEKLGTTLQDRPSMIIVEYYGAVVALKEANERKSLGMGGALVFDLDESLKAEDVVYAYRRCCKCGGEALSTLNEEPPTFCLCGHPHLEGVTADIVIQGCVVLYNHNRDRKKT
jgi:hypothetical protein